ncbi:MAG: CRISPR-associated endonuclease Cas2 [Proteobacteria bacterium]|nr:CRISPR-associated endonuclease Cas2 [Pseudomonadota bacterium]MBU1730369.1 CRISPR-associated endonuclease Cas2 [Patescibacteria group bacterium]MBU1956174.1 CRISPR-associated endonuclease Cas2 [Patescibacteria group bacterium]MBU2416408.1 CRISPR-associated endonuclease Cas2 [Patescibacteria group bacterium]
MSKKVILLLGGGLLLGLSRNPNNYFKILKAIGKEWGDIDKRALHRAIKNLYKSKIIDVKEDKNGVTTLVLTEKGKQKVLKYNLDKIIVPKMKKWDNKWRVVIFDIPESRKKIRDALRFHLKKMGFFEFQKSVFIHPFNCQDEIDYLIEFYGIRRYLRFLVAESIDNELHLQKHFNLL